MYETTSMRIMERMMTKYVRVIEFYNEAKSKEQVECTKRILQHVLKLRKRSR